MTREDLFEAIGNLDDKTVEGNIVTFPKRRNQTVRWIGLAASVVILATAVVLLPRAFRGAGSKDTSGGSGRAASTEAGSYSNGEGEVVMEGDDGLSAMTGIYWVTETQTTTEDMTEAASSESMAQSEEYGERVLSQELLEENGLYGSEILFNFFGLDSSLESVEVDWKDADGGAHTSLFGAGQDEIREFMKYLGSSEMELAKSNEAEPAYTVTLQLNDGGEVTLGLFGEGIVRIMDDTIYSEDEAFWRGRTLMMDKEAYDRFVENVRK